MCSPPNYLLGMGLVAADPWHSSEKGKLKRAMLEGNHQVQCSWHKSLVHQLIPSPLSCVSAAQILQEKFSVRTTFSHGPDFPFGVPLLNLSKVRSDNPAAFPGQERGNGAQSNRRQLLPSGLAL